MVFDRWWGVKFAFFANRRLLAVHHGDDLDQQYFFERRAYSRQKTAHAGIFYSGRVVEYVKPFTSIRIPQRVLQTPLRSRCIARRPASGFVRRLSDLPPGGDSAHTWL